MPHMTDQPLISVDVVPLHLDRRENTLGVLSVIVGERIYEPHLGAPALPGVLLGHERVEEAVARALRSKIGADHVDYLSDAGVFDNPDRDPRGPTLSIAKVAVLTHLPQPLAEGPAVSVIPLADFAHSQTSALLPFDHDHIVRSAAAALHARFWSAPGAARALLGESFTIRSLVGILDDIAAAAGHGGAADPANVQRTLRNTGWAAPTEAVTTGRGRPPLLWRWNTGSE